MKQWINRSLAALLALSLLAGCSQTAPGDASSVPQQETSASEAEPTIPEPPQPEPEPPTETDAVSLLLQNMTLREKVGQLFLVRPDALDLSQTEDQIEDPAGAGVTELSGAMADTLAQYPVGGLVLFGKNIASPEQTANFIRDMQAASGTPLFIAVDEEGGLVARLANDPAFAVRQYQSAASVGESGDLAAAMDMGATIGAYLRQYGFNLDFAPVADVNSNPKNTVIGTRAFSSDADVAAGMAKAMAEGLKQEQIIPTFKHFPGHGDTAEDSHVGIAVSYKTKAEMEACEWLPYASLTAQDCVMVGHIAAPAITGNLTPASMSGEIVGGILRQQLNFPGVVITDSLEMGAITQEYSPAEAAVTAIEAGCDILLCPEDLQAAFEAVMNAAENGTISQACIDESVSRILLLKQSYGLLK